MFVDIYVFMYACISELCSYIIMHACMHKGVGGLLFAEMRD